jgi:hypothetical protein
MVLKVVPLPVTGARLLSLARGSGSPQRPKAEEANAALSGEREVVANTGVRSFQPVLFEREK